MSKSLKAAYGSSRVMKPRFASIAQKVSRDGNKNCMLYRSEDVYTVSLSTLSGESKPRD